MTSRPQYSITNLKLVPWNYRGGMGKTSECTAVWSRNNSKPAAKPMGEITEEKEIKFLTKMGHNEAKVVKALEAAPTQFSILDLVLTSKDHRKVLIKVLGEAHLPKTVDTERFSHLITHVLDSNIISFTDNDIPVEGTGHRKPLHIAVISLRYVLGGVLIDGGSALNICP